MHKDCTLLKLQYKWCQDEALEELKTYINSIKYDSKKNTLLLVWEKPEI